MKEIVPESVLKDYMLCRTICYEDYAYFRKVFANQYATVLAVNYIFGIETQLGNNIIELNNGSISVFNLKINKESKELTPYSARLSRNIKSYIGKVHINGSVLPSFIATIVALTNKKLNFKSYLNLFYEDLDRLYPK